MEAYSLSEQLFLVTGSGLCGVPDGTGVIIRGLDMFGGGNSRDAGNWTGWLCDQQSMKTIGQTIDREGYLERYPKGKAISLNTLFSGFVLYHHGEWLVLDHHGSQLAKSLIKRSSSNSGFYVVVEGIRKEGKIKVNSINEKTRPGSGGEYVVDKGEQNKNIRQDFKKMGI